MERDDVWRAIDAHRISLADELDRLTDEEWSRPSLCPGWTVRDVGAHLTLQQARLGDVVGAMLRARGNLDRAIRDMSCREAARLSTEDIIARIRGMVGSQRHNFGVTSYETLIDILVHSQDITIPLGRPLPLDPAAAAVAASRVWGIRYFHTKKRMRGLRYTATDTDWSAGEGREVRGPMTAILLVLTGRPVAADQLAGAP